jgi:CheY-like chemotaxis protein
VLVVDDDDDLRRCLCDLLEYDGYSVAEARNGREALDWLFNERERPIVILLDMLMPVMAGKDLLAILRNYVRLSKIPVIVMSAAELETDTLSTGQLLEFFSKPLNYDRLADRLKALAAT